LIRVSTDVCASEPLATRTMGSTNIRPNMTVILSTFRPCRWVVGRQAKTRRCTPS
jgi:hypothetical protein